MMRCAFCLLLVLALGGIAVADEDGGVRGRGWWGDLDKGEVIDLRDAVAKPRQFAGRQLTFFCIYREQDDVFVPQGTIFSRAKYTNASCWPDGAAVWEQEAYQKEEFPFLYIQRTHSSRDALVRLPRYTRIEVTGRIRSIVRERPFIEILSWRETGHRLGQTVVDAMAWGDIYARGGKTELATAKYVEALTPDLPPAYDLKIRKRAADSMRRLGYPEEAARIERGEEAIGGTELPAPPANSEPGTVPVAPDMPGFAPVDGPPSFPSPDGTPAVSGDDVGVPPTTRFDLPGTSDLPGQPYDAPDVRPGAAPMIAPSTPTPAPAQPKTPAVNPENPFLSMDLPGQPVNSKATAPGKADVRPVPTPRSPTGTAPLGAFPPPTVAGPTTSPAPASTPPKRPAAEPSTQPRTDPRRPVLPPSRRPRLVGVR